MIGEQIVEQIAARLHQVQGEDASKLLKNRWLQLGVAVAIGYAIGRSRGAVQLGSFGRTLATAAAAALFRSAMNNPGGSKPSTTN